LLFKIFAFSQQPPTLPEDMIPKVGMFFDIEEHAGDMPKQLVFQLSGIGKNIL